MAYQVSANAARPYVQAPPAAAGAAAGQKAPGGAEPARHGRWPLGAAAVVLVLVAAWLWPGYEQLDTPRETTSIWALQTISGSHYGRVNTELAQMDAVQDVDKPTAVFQDGETALLFTSGYQRATLIDNAQPEDLAADASGAAESPQSDPAQSGGESHQPAKSASSVALPPGVHAVSQAGSNLLFRGADDGIYAAKFESPDLFTQVTDDAKPTGDDEQSEQSGKEREPVVALAGAINADQDARVVGYSPASAGRASHVFIADAATGHVTKRTDIELANAGDLQMAWAGGDWAALDTTAGTLTTSKAQTPLSLDLAPGPVFLQQSSTVSGTVLIADSLGLWRAQVDGSGAERVYATPGAGAVPAAPQEFAGGRYAAWVFPGESAGVLWSEDEESDAGDAPDEQGQSAVAADQSAGAETEEGHALSLDYAGASLGDAPDLRFQTNGDRLIVSEVTSGWVWLAPSGELVPSSQHWDLDEQKQVETQDVEVKQVLQPKPPVAEPDTFGARPGTSVALPVLLNDYDANEDALSIVPSSLRQPDAAFGKVSLSDDAQQLILTTNPTAKGDATFSYQVTDGTTDDGQKSDAATVAVTIADKDANLPPVWCGDDPGCLAKPASAQVAPGGTATLQVLSGWVDPEGDQLYVSAAVNGSDVGNVVARPDGRITYQHPDPGATEAIDVPITVTVSDDRGATAQQTVRLRVTPTPTLEMRPVVVSTAAKQPVEVTLDDYVTGVRGRPTVGEVTSLGDAAVSIKKNPATLGFVFEADEPGSYPLQVDLKDEGGEATGLVRVIVEPADKTQVSTTPLTIFLRPGEDATADVVAAATNPAGGVLVVGDLEVEPVADATVKARVVGQQYIHVTGGTDSGQAGPVGRGTYTVSDGTGDPRGTAEGQLTMVMLGEAPEVPPVAAPDWVTVTAGTQEDIPVLANDSAPLGTQIAIDPASVQNVQEAGLAFATPSKLRYLAPDEPGDYTVSYAAYRLGQPSLTATTDVNIKVVEATGAGEPAPTELSARVLTGSDVDIPFSPGRVGLAGQQLQLERVVDQPTKGNASVAADGASFTYTAKPDQQGQDSFTYAVRGADGKVGRGTVRIGILAAEADPSPLAYTDYLQIQAGAGERGVVFPAANDTDPAGGGLTLIDVVPNAVAGTAEYKELESRLAGWDEESGEVTIAAGDNPGTASYQYTVRSERGAQSVGLIIVKVVREPVPDVPLIRDTRLTAETLPDLPGGVDVLEGKASWNTGSVADLKLSVWGDQPDYSAKGWQVSGPLPEEPRIIPFAVAADSFQGEPTESYGFLHVPTSGDVPLAVKESFAGIEAPEGESGKAGLEAIVAYPAGEKLEVDAGGVRASGVRAAGRCQLSDGAVTYTAGEGSPWDDTCDLPVRVAGQQEYTVLHVPVTVVPKAPQPKLQASALEVSPGSTSTLDLNQMVLWEGGKPGETPQFQVGAAGGSFDVTKNGATLTVSAHDNARSGAVESLVVTLANYPDVSAAPIALTVGPAPSALPRGGTVVQSCSQSTGSSCEITVMGAPGEQNPLPGTPLKLVSVSPASCPGVSFSASSATTVTASWGTDTPGASSCLGSFVVQDAQGRQSSADRNGQIILDLRGLPAPPSRVEWLAYNENSVGLQAVSGGSSYPALTGYEIDKGGTCTSEGLCGVTGLENGQAQTFNVYAVNSEGRSRTAASIEAWAFAKPEAPAGGSAEPAANGAAGGLATVKVSGIDTKATSKIVVSGGDQTQEIAVSSATAEFKHAVPNSPTAITVTPVTSFRPPPISDGSTEGSSLTISGAHGVGAPTVAVDYSVVGETTVSATASVVDRAGGDNVLTGVSFGAAPCEPSSPGSATGTHSGNEGDTVKVTACAANTVAGTEVRGVDATGTAEIPISTKPVDPKYTVNTRGERTDDGQVVTWQRVTSNVTASRGFTVAYSDADGRQQSLESFFSIGGPADPGVYAHYCKGGKCSEGVKMSAANSEITNWKSLEWPVVPPSKTCPDAAHRGNSVVRNGFGGRGGPDEYTSSGEEQTWTVRVPWGDDEVWTCKEAEEPDTSAEDGSG